MKKFLILAALSFSSVAHAAPYEPSDVIPTQGGNIRITPKFHASLQIEYRGKVIAIDPVSAASWTKKADLILITHSHPDHYDKATILKIAKPSAWVVLPSSMVNEANALGKQGLGTQVMGNVVITKNLESFPAYNLKRGPKPGQFYHPKGQWNGYILTLGGKRIYIAGDTEATPEMKALKNTDVAFLPMNLPYTMTPQEAASAARAFKPRIVYPYHYRYPFNKANNNPQQFAAALKGTNIQVRIRNWYPDAAVKKMMTAMAK